MGMGLGRACTALPPAAYALDKAADADEQTSSSDRCDGREIMPAGRTFGGQCLGRRPTYEHRLTGWHMKAKRLVRRLVCMKRCRDIRLPLGMRSVGVGRLR
jgi:hypothetical protein